MTSVVTFLNLKVDKIVSGKKKFIPPFSSSGQGRHRKTIILYRPNHSITWKSGFAENNYSNITLKHTIQITKLLFSV